MMKNIAVRILAAGLLGLMGAAPSRAETFDSLLTDTVADIANGSQPLEGVDKKGLMNALGIDAFRQKLSETIDLTRSQRYDADCGACRQKSVRKYKTTRG